MLAGLLTLLATRSFAQAEPNPLLEGMATTVNSIGLLEGKRDPKCYATASRLEDFIAGTPLSEEARMAKITLQKDIINRIWILGDERGRVSGASALGAEELKVILSKIAVYGELNSGDWVFETRDGTSLTIEGRDKRQYASVAYALRAVLAVQQEQLFRSGEARLPLQPSAVEELKRFLDIYSLATLQLADAEARNTDEAEIGAKVLVQAWVDAGNIPYIDEESLASKLTPNAPNVLAPFELTKRVVSQKIASYEEYNHISLPVFLRNIQVYFARHRWPTDAQESDRMKAIFTEAMISYAGELMQGAEGVGRKRGRLIMQLDDVGEFAASLIPVDVNSFEDATFFPRFPATERITIESYDMDAFRDSGLHWQYLRAAIDEPGFRGSLEPDPFALELLAENVAQFGVLLLRVSGQVATTEDVEVLAPQHIRSAMGKIQEMVVRYAELPEEVNDPVQLASVTGVPRVDSSSPFFTDVTTDYGLRFNHRSSDWLSRFIRTHSVRDQSVAVLAVPPAFGGSGIAAEDINNDGLPDLLLLGGGGTQLLLNDGKGGLVDITRSSGIAWVRDDGLPGETRQPIIADFNNDGLQDIFISYVNDNHRLYRNVGDGTFDDVTDAAGLGGEGLVGGPATAMDFDKDGLLDIYVTYFGQYIEGILPTLARKNVNGLPNRLLRNTGSMRFEDVTEGSGVAGSGWTQATAHTDFNLDGWQDLIEGNDFGVNAYYMNKGDGTFEDVTARLGTGKPSYTMSIGIADLNRDRVPDFYISNIVTMDKDQKYVDPSAETEMKFDANTLAEMRVIEANDLFVSQGTKDALSYIQSDVVSRGRSSTGWAWGADFFDFDCDGDDDLYVANGMNEFSVYSSEHPYYQDPSGENRNVEFPESTRETNVFFLNEGGKLLNMSPESGADLYGNSRAVVYVDLDQDGDLDMVLNNYHEPATIFRNNSERIGNHWLKISLVGDPSMQTTRDAIGAKLVVRTADGKEIWREVHGGGAYLTLHPKVQHFGLGKSTVANLEVQWPNGQVERYSNLSANEKHVIHQKPKLP